MSSIAGASDLAIAAEHEAAHVVVYLDFGYSVTSVALYDDGSGVTTSASQGVMNTDDHAAALMAGTVIEDRHDPIPLADRIARSKSRREHVGIVNRLAEEHDSTHTFLNASAESSDLASGPAGVRDITDHLIKSVLDDIDLVDLELIETGYHLAKLTLECRAHDHRLITAALLKHRFLTADDIYALPLCNLPREPWK